MRFLVAGAVATLLALALVAALAAGSTAGLVAAALLGVLVALAVYDLIQRRHSILRNYPLAGHMRFLLEAIRPELQQYFIERDFDGRPFERNVRTAVYEQAKGEKEEQATAPITTSWRSGTKGVFTPPPPWGRPHNPPSCP